MISEERLEKALRFLAESDEDFAESKVHMLRLDYALELARKREFLTAEGNNEERKAKAESSDHVQTVQGTYLDAVGAFEKKRAKRATEELIVEVWRSLEASRRQGRI
jgi:hypothetical protein